MLTLFGGALTALTLVFSQGSPAFQEALKRAEKALDQGTADVAREHIDRALERDAKSAELWGLVARWAALAGDADEEVYARHKQYELVLAQGAAAGEAESLRAALDELDPIARDLLTLRERFLAKLEKIATKYEEEGRPHAAIGVHKEILALDSERLSSEKAIERIAAAPDPSLAEFAQPVDLFADVSEEWIAEFDAEHGTWDEHAVLERENYRTQTDAGYRVLLTAAEAMDQMNAFYRVFFRYATEEHGGSVPRIDLRIFKTREEYLELGEGPPVEWSGGHFTGGAVETYVTGGDPTQMYGTLFHEAAHQFVSLATTASGWLNEGLASFFEGCRILPNGTVQMNEPADHRLLPLAARMERGWMRDHEDGTDPSDPNKTPETAPTFRIIVGNHYQWGPPWYAPTWGLVYFLYNYQDSFDGRFVYRDAFLEFLNTPGGRTGDGAVAKFEETVLGNPRPAIKGLDRAGAEELALPRNVEQLDEIWKAWTLRLRDERLGKIEVERPYLQWARFAVQDENFEAAKEHFEKALINAPEDPYVRIEFAELLHAELASSDRAAGLVVEGLRMLDGQEGVNEQLVKNAERLLKKADPARKTLTTVHDELFLVVQSLLQRYRAAERPKMVMHLAWRFGTELGFPELFDLYAEAARDSGKSLQLWRLAYNEENLDGWGMFGAEGNFKPVGASIVTRFDEYDEKDFDYRFIVLEELTAGDFSFEAEFQADRRTVNFGGLVFGRKGPRDFHSLIVFPPRRGDQNAYVDLASFYEGGTTKTWRHSPVPRADTQVGSSTASVWHKLRVDVTGTLCDTWIDGVYQGTNDFNSRSVLRGGLGIITGKGRARFRNVRFMTSHPRDPAPKLERDLRITELQVLGGGQNGSFLGYEPPWLDAKRWVQGERGDWHEKGPVPQLVVFWSRAQNDVIAIDGWLRELATKHESIGLEIVSVCSPNDDADIEAYLEEHPLPGGVAVDARHREGVGSTFETYWVDKFLLPRVLLLDIDGRVLWEGEPGFERASPWSTGKKSFLTDPLNLLIEKRRLDEFLEWRRGWFEAGGREGLASGAFDVFQPLLREAQGFDDLSDDVKFASRQYDVVSSALAAFESTCGNVAELGFEPVLPVLVEWGELCDWKLDKKRAKPLEEFLEGRAVKQWRTAVKAAERYAKKAKPGSEAAEATELIRKIERFERGFAQALLVDVQSAHEAEDWQRLKELCETAHARPREWLATEFFGW